MGTRIGTTLCITFIVMVFSIHFDLVSEFVKGIFLTLIIEMSMFFLYMLYRPGGPIVKGENKERVDEQ